MLLRMLEPIVEVTSSARDECEHKAFENLNLELRNSVNFNTKKFFLLDGTAVNLCFKSN